MTSKSRKPKSRKELSRAELKAYEARRADERKRIGTSTGSANPLESVEPARIPLETSFAMTKQDEFRVIKADLVRLSYILAVITVLMVVLTIFLR